MTRLMSADIATTTGVGTAFPGENIRLSHFRISTEDAAGQYIPLGHFFHTYRQCWVTLLDRERPDVLILESPVLNSYRVKKGGRDVLVKDNMTKVRKLCGMVAIVQELCAERGIVCREFQPAEVKKMLSGHAVAVKDHMVNAARVMGFDPQTDDEADALGLLMCGAERYLPKLFFALRERQKRPAWFENISALKKQATQKRAVKKARAAPKSKTQGTLL